MKKVLLILLIAGFGFWGCSENTSLTEPTKIETQSAFLKLKAGKVSLLKQSEVTKTIDGERGGIVRINLEDEEDFGAKGWLFFSKGSFEGSQDITIKTDTEFAALDFYPEGISLEKPARLTVIFKGIEFDDDEPIDFQYIDENDNLASVDYSRLIVYRELGWVIVVDAKLYHFSRYGFTK